MEECVPFTVDGYLPPGVHVYSISRFKRCFGFNEYRMQLIAGFEQGVKVLSSFGCTKVYVDGSFVTEKEVPNDYDCCWLEDSVDLVGLINSHPVFWDFRNNRREQKRIYMGEFWPASLRATPSGETILQFFQRDRDGTPKGIIQIGIK